MFFDFYETLGWSLSLADEIEINKKVYHTLGVKFRWLVIQREQNLSFFHLLDCADKDGSEIKCLSNFSLLSLSGLFHAGKRPRTAEYKRK